MKQIFLFTWTVLKHLFSLCHKVKATEPKPIKTLNHEGMFEIVHNDVVKYRRDIGELHLWLPEIWSRPGYSYRYVKESSLVRGYLYHIFDPSDSTWW